MAEWITPDELGCLQVGDIIETPVKIPGTSIAFPIFKHYGIVIKVCDELYVCHLPGRVDPILESLENFEKRRVITRVLRNDETESLSNEELINNYHEIANKKYSFWNYNCEDFITLITKDKVKIGTDQRCGWIWVVLILFIIYLLYRIIRKK